MTTSRVEDLEIIIQEPRRIASTKRSSTTREYIGAVDSIEDLREGRGEFGTPAEFYSFWRKHPFKVSAGIQQQLDRMVRQQAAELSRLREGQVSDEP